MARRKVKCVDCGAELKKDEVALCRKLAGEGTQDYMCLSCHAEFIGCSCADLKTKIAEFKEQGCTLFI